MLQAKDAAKINWQYEENKEEIKLLETGIHQAASRGEWHVTIANITEFQKQALVDAGYHIAMQGRPEEKIHTISWQHMR